MLIFTMQFHSVKASIKYLQRTAIAFADLYTSSRLIKIHPLGYKPSQAGKFIVNEPILVSVFCSSNKNIECE